MPLDGHSYLIAQGWRGNGTGLRDGAISRPLAIPQKKNLAGLGKDRDEAFPFWDHVFSAAAKSIQLKFSSDSDGDDDAEISSCSRGVIKHTMTGIVSNCRPVEGLPVTYTLNTTNTRNLLATAKREAAKKNLYSRFFRGPVLGSNDEERQSISTKSGNPPVDPKKRKRRETAGTDTKKHESVPPNAIERKKRKKEKKRLDLLTIQE